MKRRGNKSNKVPNVKLRPAQEVSSRRVARTSTQWAQDTQPGSDASIVDLCPRPFRRVIVCATGVVDKPALFKQAVELGAIAVSAFTDRVTHLVAADHGGAKYVCALERKIPILTPSWITDSYQIWLRGDDVDLGESVDTHRLPIFSGVVLCPSGITKITARTEINKLITLHGGVYSKNLERPVKVTHLLCSGDEETDKMKYAEKFNQRGEANVHLVWEEWFWDSLEFGGRFDEEKYQVRRPRPAPKKSQMQATSPPPSSSFGEENRASNDEATPLENGDNLPEEELATVRRLPITTLQVWGSLLGRRGYEISDGQLIRSPTKSRATLMAQPTVRILDKPTGNGSLISQFRRANSFAPARPDPPSAQPQPFRRTKTTSAVDPQGHTSGSPVASDLREPEKVGGGSASSATPNIFHGAKFVALGEAKSPSVRTAIEESGGRMVLNIDDEDVDFIVVRLVSGSKFYREESDASLRVKYRTECWLERCIFNDRICPPEDHVTFTPLSIQIPIPGAEKVNLSFSGLDQSEACWVTRLLRALGVNLAQFFSRKTTHLLCPSGTGLKFDKACQWEIPVITMEWLAVIASSGSIPPFSQFLVPGSNVPGGRALVKETVTFNVVSEGKGNAIQGVKGKVLPGNIEGDAYNVYQSPERDNRPLSSQNSSNHLGMSSPERFPLQSISFGRITDALTGPSRSQHHRSSPVTTPSRTKTTSEAAPFGKPTGALGGALLVQSPQTTPSRTNSTPVVRTTPRSSHPKTLSAPNLLPPSDPTSKPTRVEIERERKQARIPSSKSPSPMKIPPKSQLKRVPTELPSSPSREATKALQDNIETLLGKRQPSENEIVVNARAGKRPRARPKAASRQSSDAQLSEISSVPVVPPFDDSMSPFETFEDFSLAEHRVVEDSMRVTYEDPGQREERKRLMGLLKGGGIEKDSAVVQGVKTRRSSRIAGF